MFAFILRRFVAMVGVLVGVGLLTFVISHVVPADPAVLLAGGPRATPADIAAVRHRLGLDRPLICVEVSAAA